MNEMNLSGTPFKKTQRQRTAWSTKLKPAAKSKKTEVMGPQKFGHTFQELLQSEILVNITPTGIEIGLILTHITFASTSKSAEDDASKQFGCGDY